jgi:hypothetical protein
MASIADAQVTRTATFENFAAGQAFQPSFVDPLSGITFRNSTNAPAPGGFVIDGSDHFFGRGNYLTAGGGPTDSFGASFGFTADLPAPADTLSLDAIYLADSRANVLLQGINASGIVTAEQAGPGGTSSAPFSLQITSSQFDIASFRVSVVAGASGYDNISFTIVPEPFGAFVASSAATMFLPRRKRAEQLQVRRQSKPLCLK